MSRDLFRPALSHNLELKNRIVMAPMTRNRALGNIPQDLVATYYGQRSGAGLIVTEGTSPSPNGLGYPRIPGIFSAEQMAGWRQVTNATQAGGSKIFIQLMHTGRIGHSANLPPGAEVLGATSEAAPGEIWTDASGMQPHGTPRAMTEADLQQVIADFVQGAINARNAGFDGVELHSANGYLLEQFLNPVLNQRTDAWGGTKENRARLLLEITRQTASAIGADRVGIRLSPHGVFNSMAPYPEVETEYAWLAAQLAELKVAYLHLVDHSPMGAPPVPEATKAAIRKAFVGTLILCGGYDRARAQAALDAGQADLIAFGRPFIANPDLVERLQNGSPLADPDPATFYTPGAAGYTDYPALG
ncbi:MAG: alkene reductase [Holophaga sp.]|nr:alkene reductase [Holophaga sp.]